MRGHCLAVHCREGANWSLLSLGTEVLRAASLLSLAFNGIFISSDSNFALIAFIATH